MQELQLNNVPSRHNALLMTSSISLLSSDAGSIMSEIVTKEHPDPLKTALFALQTSLLQQVYKSDVALPKLRAHHSLFHSLYRWLRQPYNKRSRKLKLL